MGGVGELLVFCAKNAALVPYFITMMTLPQDILIELAILLPPYDRANLLRTWGQRDALARVGSKKGALDYGWRRSFL